jgi:hypothetical protein
MGFKSLLVFILGVFAMLIVFIAYAISTNSPLDNIDVYQTVSVNKADAFDIRFRGISNKPYILVTSSEDVEDVYPYDPRFKIVDYGTYHEIDSLKCLRFKQMKCKVYHLEKLNEKTCD